MTDYHPAEARDADRSDQVYRWAGDQDAAWLRRDQARCFAQANNWPAYLAIRSAEGSLVEDFSGREYIDLHGNNCHHLGHNHPALIEAIGRQMSALCFNSRGFTNRAFIEFSELIAELWPGNDPGLFLLPGGSAAVELSLMLARVHTGKYKTISFQDSFHGRSLGAIGLTDAGLEKSARLGPMIPGARYVPSFKTRGDQRLEEVASVSLQAIKTRFREEIDIACLIAEPIANGGFRPPDWYWPEVRRLCDRHGSLLIFDEIPLGLGKTGSMFCSESVAVVPDMTVLGKALGGAILPVAAVIAGRHLDSAGEMNLGYFTHEKNPLMARVASRLLQIVQTQKLAQRARDLEPELLARLHRLQLGYPGLVRSIRGAGMIHSLEMSSDREAGRLFYAGLRHGVIFNYAGYGSSLRLSFPLNIENALIEDSFRRVEQALRSVRQGAVS